MGRSKPRTNKRPPPKIRPNLPTQPSPSPTPIPNPSTSDQYATPPSIPPPSFPSLPTDILSVPRSTLANADAAAARATATAANLSAALSSWSANTLGRMEPMPKLTESQLSVLAGAAAGIGEANFLSGMSASRNGQSSGSAGEGQYSGGIPIDLPASLAALFEAKLTLDREKAKLMRMQKELRGQRESIKEVEMQMETQRMTSQMTADRIVASRPVPALEEGCTCGQCLAYAPESEPECYDCEDDCACDCHSYEEYECSHDHHDYEEEEEYHEKKRPLSEDPARLDETVRELFNWIKAVVWTIEQAAIVSGRRNWKQSPTKAE
ncbi:hypothetical protein C343_06267 [Cryptococcus neoformans C23]|uniref:Uncharacterized protein n=2 Tax=Cryptococcus neoformans TaxID=5207 RepID=A0A854Q5R5_CRYNE|nr:hypothetical protein CNAG_06062 [Cryptococcus neoformans var. grubii H99]AUB28413.1 hypothetical protein CKF44_06062 [Cryptococcus neoformans var. grubii]OWZ27098.1 hypothetical protein C347_06267 [Cryptococcus neoformans var. grubii AD2-60a]OWZ28998.1 hypothetical protein C356_06249 [Cryptococcus neoformans var. grubii c45]OWZ29084.1 hypothetical protein C353_06290 [Cryptococcus neoformans var. grubii AD1-83a]OWZ39060.1 hypothetical protein C343_06267 [Cryptococcus neoformans var. grubii C|eukprot:XP_012053107.1 hypothetical protein CNAG_06062 [Cryptococcus neoformans var. grubii H99]